MSGQEILVRCRRQCDLANQEDVSGLRGAWIELSAVAWVEVHCHNFDAARRAYEKARAVFAGAAAEYDELLAVIDHDLPLLEDLSRSAQQLPAYDECLFDHPYYWGAFVLLGRWNC
jgi:CHAT domain-containing protein